MSDGGMLANATSAHTWLDVRYIPPDPFTHVVLGVPPSPADEPYVSQR